MLALQHDACREDTAVLGTFRESKNGYPYTFHLMGAIPGPPPKKLLEACDYIINADDATSEDGGGGSSKASAPEPAEDDAAAGGGEDSQPAEVEASTQRSEEVHLFSIIGTPERRCPCYNYTSLTLLSCR